MPLPRGVVLLRPEHTPELRRHIREEGGVVRARTAVLTTSDERALNRRHHGSRVWVGNSGGRPRQKGRKQVEDVPRRVEPIFDG